MALLLTVGPAANGQVNLPNERPQFLLVVVSGGILVPNVQMTGNKSGSLLNLDYAGLQTLGQQQQKTAFTSSFLFPMGSGKGFESTTISATTGAGTTVNVYGFSLNNSTLPPIKYDMVTQNQNSTLSYSKFFQMGFFPQAGETYSVQGLDGLQSQMTAPELRQLAGQDLNLINSVILFNNYQQVFGQITLSSGANPITIYRSYLASN